MMSAKGEALCHTCLKVLCDIAASSDTRAIFTHELPYNKLLQAVQNGCPLCTRLQAAGILSKYDAVVSVKLFKNVDIPQNGSLLIFVSARKDVKDRLFRLRQIDPLREYSAHSNLLLEQASYKSGSTGSAPCTSLVRQWINLCSGNHACSYRSVAPNPTPTRLIFVGETSDDIRLCETEKMPKALEYTTVSHRWGIISDRCVLESSTLGEWLRKIPERAITKVFQDAIRLTRSLGLSYIWIDCCCIIQDSEDDWQREASRMSEIYRNSYCTISASGAEHAGDGCFFDRDLALNASFHFAAPTAVDLHGASDEVSLYEVSEHRIWLNGVEKTRLNSRGWVFQERLLSPRTLFYAQSQIFWECGSLQACETHPFGYMIETTDESIIKFNKDSFLLSFKDSGYQLLVKKWLRVVQLYSRKHLTKRKDKLVAISAIALWHSRALREHEYAAGVWIHEYSTIGLSHVEMLYQLYWKASLAVQREQEYVAPSWSWACMNGGITFPDHSMNGEPLARVFSVETELTSAKNYFGQVKSGLLRLNGVLKTMQDVLSHKVGRIDFEPLSHGEEKQLALAQTSGISMYLDCHPGLDPTISVSTVEATKGCYILILLEEALEGHFGFRSGFIGLILRETKDLRVVPVSYHSEPLYERVGLIDITHTWGDESAFQERQEQINFWSEFEATHVDGRVRYRLRPDETRYRTVALV